MLRFLAFFLTIIIVLYAIQGEEVLIELGQDAREMVLYIEEEFNPVGELKVMIEKFKEGYYSE